MNYSKALPVLEVTNRVEPGPTTANVYCMLQQIEYNIFHFTLHRCGPCKESHRLTVLPEIGLVEVAVDAAVAVPDVGLADEAAAAEDLGPVQADNAGRTGKQAPRPVHFAQYQLKRTSQSYNNVV